MFVDTARLEMVGNINFYLTILSDTEYHLEAEGQDLTLYRLQHIYWQREKNPTAEVW